MLQLLETISIFVVILLLQEGVICVKMKTSM